jgi:ABC-type dipeptide/oligopeptide/nickel transport system ATPase component
MLSTINNDLLKQAGVALSSRKHLYWIVGGSGSGKTTICQALAEIVDLSVYDMDAHIYETYHGRFSPTRHPVNSQWAAAPNGLAWLLAMSWQEFEVFNQAAVPEYLDLLAEDVAELPSEAGLLIDGGIFNTAVAAQAFPASQMVCLSRPELSSAEIWQETPERLGMKAIFTQFPNPEKMWLKFLEFDKKINQTILLESQAAQIQICLRKETDSVKILAQRVAAALQL